MKNKVKSRSCASQIILVLVGFCGLIGLLNSMTNPERKSSVPTFDIPTPTYQMWELVSSQGVMNFVLVHPEYKNDYDEILSISKSVCGSLDVCVVMFWDDVNKMATSIPMTDEQVNSKIAQYNYNKNTGLDRLLLELIE